MALLKIYCRTSHCQGCNVHRADIEKLNDCAIWLAKLCTKLMVNDHILSGLSGDLHMYCG